MVFLGSAQNSIIMDMLRGELPAGLDERGVGHVLARPAGHEVHAQLGADDHQGVAHVVARIAQVSVADLAQRFVAVFLHGQNVSQHLRLAAEAAAAFAVAVMCLLPNAGSFGLTIGGAMIFGLIALMLLDTSINMAMQPFKMLVGDMVNEKQKTLAYSIQSFLCNAGSIAGYVFPFFFTFLGISNQAPSGVVPDSVVYSFYIGAAILILCVIYTTAKVKEMPPKEYAEYHSVEKKDDTSKSNVFTLLKVAPPTFWKVGLVQFFCWFAFMYMWTYTNGTVAANCWGVDMLAHDATMTKGYQEAGNWVGILFAIQAIGSVVWAMVLPQFKNTKLAYSFSLILGAAGFVLAAFIHNQYVMFIPFILIGCAWAAILAMPFTLVTNALEGYGHLGTYLGLFNGTICIPQIIAAAIGGVLLQMVGSVQSNMMIVAGVSLFLGAMSVGIIKVRRPAEQG